MKKLTFLILPLLLLPSYSLAKSFGDYQGAVYPQNNYVGKKILVSQKAKNKSIPAPNPLPLPPTGIYKRYFIKSEGVAPLGIALRASDQDAGYHFYIIVLNSRTNEILVSLFIRKGKSIEIQLPLGEYKIRYAAGKDWFGDNDLFGLHTTAYSDTKERIFKFKKTIEIDGRRETTTFKGHSLELYAQIFGNLETRTISRSQFFNFKIPTKEIIK